MNLHQLIGFCAFLFAAAFSFLDVLSDCLLAKEYNLVSTCGDKSTNCPNLAEYRTPNFTAYPNGDFTEKVC